MRILMFNHEFPPIGGGAGIATFNIARELRNKGHSVDVITSSYRNLMKEECIEGLMVYRVKGFRRGLYDNTLIGMLLYICLGTLKY